MTVSDLPSLLDEQWSAQESPGLSRGERSIGFTYVRMDANRRGQPGWLWGVLAIPFGWLAILAYVVTRAVTSAQSR